MSGLDPEGLGVVLLHFSPLCVFKCVLKLVTQEDAKPHWLHLFEFSLPSVPLIGISLDVFSPKSRCSRFRPISGSVLALLIFVSNWFVKRLHMIWIGRIEIESEFYQYFLNICKRPIPYQPDLADKVVYRIFTHEQ